MKSVKFASGDIEQHSFAIAVRKNVNDYFRENDLSTKGNFTMVVQTLVMISIYLMPFILMLTVPVPGWLALLLTMVMGIGTAGIGMSVMHGAAHGAYSHKTWINDLFAGSLYTLGGNVFNWKVQHNILHHTYTNINEYDQDIASKGPIRLSEHAPLHEIHRYQHIHAFFLYALMTLFKIGRDLSQLIEFNNAGYAKQSQSTPAREYWKMAISKILYFIFIFGLPLLLTSYSFWQILLGFIIMHAVEGFILGVVFQLAHVVEGVEQPELNAEGMIERDWAVHELLTTSDFARNNNFLFWYVGGLNFQIEHHLFPNICHVHYRKIAPIVEKTAHDFGLTYNLQPTFWEALKSHVRKLKELGNPALATQG